jgi:uncharacterized RDD family membrane protein YckC
MAGRNDKSLRRRFVTPEGVDLKLDLAGGGERATAFLIDAGIVVAILVVFTLLVVMLSSGTGETGESVLTMIWLLGFFLLRNAWFTMFELSGRGATPGKRMLGLRVVARDGARLTGGAVIVRNAMREIEVFLPLSFLGVTAADSRVEGVMYLLAFAWVAVFLFFPLFNRDRLRVGDLLAGTWVVHTVRGTLAPDLVSEQPSAARRTFSDAALDLYGVYELQTLEDVLRRGHHDSIVTVAGTIRAKAGLPDDSDDYGFLTDYYIALCARLERESMLGRRRQDKFGNMA